MTIKPPVFLLLIIILSLVISGCTDAATRLGGDIVTHAHDLKKSSQTELTFSHQPKYSPEGCSGAYTVTLQESLHHPTSGGSILVGCIGEKSFQTWGYSYSTSYHLNALSVPSELTARKEMGASLQVTLQKIGNLIEVIGLK